MRKTFRYLIFIKSKSTSRSVGESVRLRIPVMEIKKFKQIIWKYYRDNKRVLPWRTTRDPYKILVSEVMLQQTQVSRVEIKYKTFLKKFPNIQMLAQSPLKDVLIEWQGLGYNRRAIYLKQCSEKIVMDFNAKFPKDFKTLCTLPGIGPATAGDLMVFAWNVPITVIETNIRSVFIHFFFKHRKKKIHDKEILPLIEKSIDLKNPREWYYALFDYGTYLKKTSNPSRKSAHHTTQSKFIGSYREKRGAILRMILTSPTQTHSTTQMKKALGYTPELLSKILMDLEQEGFIRKTKNSYTAA